MSCSAMSSPPVPSTTLIAPAAAPFASCAWATGTRDCTMDSAAAVEMPAAASPFRKLRREIEWERKRATSSLMSHLRLWVSGVACRGVVGHSALDPRHSSLGRRSIGSTEIACHGVDLVLGPERAAPDHAVEHALPSPAVLAMVAPHTLAVALAAQLERRFPPRRVGKPDRLALLRQRGRSRARERARKERCSNDGGNTPAHRYSPLPLELS